MRHRYSTLAVFLGILALAFGAVKGGFIKWDPFPMTPGDSITCGLEMSLGTPAETTEGHLKRIISIADELQKKYINPETGQSEILNIMAVMGGRDANRAQVGNAGQPHLCEVVLELPPIDDRKVESATIKEEWRKAVGDISGARELRFSDSWGRYRAGLEIQIAGQELKDMLAVSQKMQDKMKVLAGVKDVFDDYATGKQEILADRVLPEAAARGITLDMVGQQLRQAFYGSEAQRIQRGRDDADDDLAWPGTRVENLLYDTVARIAVLLVGQGSHGGELTSSAPAPTPRSRGALPA